jgi:outer membrane protein OmpA-like peptidoglycan-associated protein
MTTTNTQPTHSKNELLRELVIAIGCLAMLLSGVGALYWMQTRPDEATAETTLTVAAKAGDAKPGDAKPVDAKPGEMARPKAEVVTTDGAVVHADVYFDFKSTRLRADAAKMLQDKAATMSHSETWAVLVMGYSDTQGPAGYNRILAQRRGDTVKQFLVDLGVPESSIKVVALGPDATLCDDPGKECQQLNRRVHLEIRRLGPLAAASPAIVAPLGPKTTDLGQP